MSIQRSLSLSRGMNNRKSTMTASQMSLTMVRMKAALEVRGMDDLTPENLQRVFAVHTRDRKARIESVGETER